MTMNPEYQHAAKRFAQASHPQEAQIYATVMMAAALLEVAEAIRELAGGQK